MTFQELNQLKVQLENLAGRYLGEDLCNEVKIFADNHPFIAATVLLTFLFSGIPIILFICFAVVTALISLICFLCVEGFLLLVGGLLLAAVVSFIAILTGGAIVSFAIAFWFAQKFHSLCCQRANTSKPQEPVPLTGEERQDADSSDT